MTNPAKAIGALFDTQIETPFVWGKTDCFSWCLACAEAVHGPTDRWDHIRGHYATPVGGARILKKYGWQTLADGAATVYAEIPVARAVTGDWAYVENEDGTGSLGVVVGGIIVSRTEDRGLGHVPLTRASRAFRVE